MSMLQRAPGAHTPFVLALGVPPLAADTARPFWDPGGWNMVDVFTLVGVPLGIVALIAAWVQLRGAKDASAQTQRIAQTLTEVAQQTDAAVRATKDAVERTERHLAENHLLLVIPELRLVAASLDQIVAGERPDRPAVIKLLLEWNSLAIDAEALLDHVDPVAYASLLRTLRKSLRATGAAKDNLIALRQDAEPATREARKVMSEVDSAAGRIVSGMKAFVRGADA